MTKFNVCILILYGVLCSNVMAEAFTNMNSRTQEYIVKQLSLVIGDSDIAILHARCDEWLREDTFLPTGQEAILGLTSLRFIKMLKGSANATYNEIIYIYEPYNKEWYIWREPVHVPPPYANPLCLASDFMQLVFMKPQLEPIRDRLQDGYQKRYPELKPFVEDAMKMDNAKEFMAKYNLTATFSNKVYQVMEGCVFRVDYPAPDMPETKAMHMNRKNWELEKAHLPKKQAYFESRIVHLTKREVSEIVFLAYLLEGEQGISQYAAMASKESVILEPITDMVFKTGIGKSLFEALKPKMKENMTMTNGEIKTLAIPVSRTSPEGTTKIFHVNQEYKAGSTTTGNDSLSKKNKTYKKTKI